MAQSKPLTILLYNNYQLNGNQPEPTIHDWPETVEIVGERYEDVYGGYMDFFKRLAETEGKILLDGAPSSWLPLLDYLNVATVNPVDKFDMCPVIFAAWQEVKRQRAPEKTGVFNPYVTDLRTTVEVLNAARPELVDAMWKIDRQWEVHPDRQYNGGFKREFIVTGNGSFDRPEVRAYEKALYDYVPTKQHVILLPCAADKPYPSKLHAAVIAMLEEEGVRDLWYIANATGVLGIVPEDLWPVMPYYDSGIPNRWNLMKVARGYFQRHRHQTIVSYMDFYGQALSKVLPIDYWNIVHINEPEFYADYLDLLDPKRFDELRRVVVSDSEAFRKYGPSTTNYQDGDSVGRF